MNDIQLEKLCETIEVITSELKLIRYALEKNNRIPSKGRRK